MGASQGRSPQEAGRGGRERTAGGRESRGAFPLLNAYSWPCAPLQHTLCTHTWTSDSASPAAALGFPTARLSPHP